MVVAAKEAPPAKEAVKETPKEAVKEEVKAPVISDASISEKVKKGEALTPEENEYIKGTPVDEKIDDAPAPKEEAETEETAAEDKEETPAEEPKTETKEDIQAQIEAELAKPEEQQDTTKFSDQALGLYWDLKKQRTRNSKLYEENEALRFELAKKKIEDDTETEVEEDDAADIPDDELITGKDLKKILAKKAAAPKKDATPKAPTPEQIKLQELEADQYFKSKGINDYKEVTEYTEFALGGDPDAGMIIREAALKGQNVGKLIYSMIKGSKRWNVIKIAIEQDRLKRNPAPEKKTPPKENLERKERIENNDKKIKTTGPGGGADEEVGEYTAEDVKNMSIDEFRQLPRETRDKILKKFGSSPNQG